MNIAHPYRTALMLGLFAGVFFFASCSAQAGMNIAKDRSASLSIAVSLPKAVESWIRSATGSASGSVLVDAQAVAEGARRSGMGVTESKAGTDGSWRGSFTIADLSAFCALARPAVPANDMGLRGSPAGSLASLGLLRYERGDGWASVSIALNRTNACSLMALVPAMDTDILEALMPPALYDNPVTLAQFSGMMEATVGTSIKEALFSFALAAPGPILEYRGPSAQLSADGRSVRFSLSSLHVMVLESPLELFVRWKQ